MIQQSRCPVPRILKTFTLNWCCSVCKFKSVVFFLLCQCSQAQRILSVLPVSWTDERVLVTVMFWSRTTDRKENWSSVVMQSLLPQEQIKVCQTLGYFNTFNQLYPEMSYQLRMYRPDEYQVAMSSTKNNKLNGSNFF